jgi:oligoendopeptidase F
MRGVAVAQGRWRLEDVLPSHEGREMEKTKARLEELTRRFESIRGCLDSFNREDVERALRIYSEIAALNARIGSYASMFFSEDTRNQRAKAFLDWADDKRADTENRTIFFRLWWVGLPEERAAELMPDDPDFRHYLTTLRKAKRYTLEERVEQAINMKNTTGFWGWSNHYDQLTSRFTYDVRVGGRVRRGLLTSEVVRMFSSADQRARVAGYDSLLEKYSKEGGVLGDVYRTVVRDWRNEYVRLRGYQEPISVRNLENDVPDRAVEVLLQTCRKNVQTFRRFFRLKGRMLGMKRMSRYHIYAPVDAEEKPVQYQDAVKRVLRAFSDFDEKFAGMARRVFESGHVDSQVREGKHSGAYCSSVVPGVVPYLFLNFTGSRRDVYTIAHELGHAVHSQLAAGHSVLTFHPQLVMAETASVFGEMILFDRMMDEERDEGARRSMLADKLTSIYSTVGRQAYISIFERDAHSAVDRGATVDDLCRLYLSNLREQFEPDVAVPEKFKWEWTYIPHIYHTPFYCYAYAFGNLLTLALYDRYRSEGRSFVASYIDLLSKGGSSSPADMLSEIGFDIESEAFWRGGFKVVEAMLSLLK